MDEEDIEEDVEEAAVGDEFKTLEVQVSRESMNVAVSSKSESFETLLEVTQKLLEKHNSDNNKQDYIK